MYVYSYCTHVSHLLSVDNLGVLPENDPQCVVAVANRLGYDLDAVFTLTPIASNSDVKPIIPTPCTISEALTRYIDLNGKVSKHTISCLAYFATDPEEVCSQVVDMYFF